MKRVEFIENAASDIIKLLEKLTSIKKPMIKEMDDERKLIDL